MKFVVYREKIIKNWGLKMWKKLRILIRRFAHIKSAHFELNISL